MKIRYGEHLRLALLQPEAGLLSMALRATAILTGMPGEQGVPAVIALVHVPTQRLGAASANILDGAPVRRQQLRAIPGHIVFRKAAEDIRNFKHGRAL
jgi:hypothetical protein